MCANKQLAYPYLGNLFSKWSDSLRLIIHNFLIGIWDGKIVSKCLLDIPGVDIEQYVELKMLVFNSF